MAPPLFTAELRGKLEIRSGRKNYGRECLAKHCTAMVPQPAERVQVVFPGSKHDNKLATVQALKEQDGLQMVVLQVDGESKPWTEVLLSWLESV